MTEIVILAVCFQLKQLKKQPEKKNNLKKNSFIPSLKLLKFYLNSRLLPLPRLKIWLEIKIQELGM